MKYPFDRPAQKFYYLTLSHSIPIPGEPAMPSELRVFIVTVVYAFLGMVLLFVGYKLFDYLTPTDLQNDIFVKGNTATAVLTGSFIIGLAIVIGLAIHG
jgi:putative membrane protein